MRARQKRSELPPDLVIAIGLVWGHMRARQFEEAWQLAKGCLSVWPKEPNLLLMASYAAAEVLEPVDFDALEEIRTPANAEWIRLVRRRAEDTSARAQAGQAPRKQEQK